jgi:hypothetical protein
MSKNAGGGPLHRAPHNRIGHSISYGSLTGRSIPEPLPLGCYKAADNIDRRRHNILQNDLTCCISESWEGGSLNA